MLSYTPDRYEVAPKAAEYSSANQTGVVVRAGREAALLVFKGWAESRVVVRVEMHMGATVASLSARVVAASDEELRLMADDSESEFALSLTASLTFLFADIRDLQGSRPGLEEFVIVFFGDVQDTSEDHVALAVDRHRG